MTVSCIAGVTALLCGSAVWTTKPMAIKLFERIVSRG
jgi:hypothetical protein